MDINGIKLSDDAKLWLGVIGYMGGVIILCAFMYRFYAHMMGKAVVAELIKAGVLTVL